ncbi:MAG: PIN domain-containing protein [Hadesarchaea archaeon]|nr:PIN domain-containing protein [Hadesarchaea archaeon]
MRIIERGELSGFASFISVAELYVVAHIVKRTDDVDALLSYLGRLPINDPVARKAGEIRAATGLPLPDCLIGSSALLSGMVLTTYNIKHFSRIRGLKVKTPQDLIRQK